MALPRGFNTEMQVEGYRPSKGPNIFYLRPGQSSVLVFLEDDPIRVCRHKIFLKGDSTASRMRQTCAGMNPDEFKKPVPRMCKACNGALRHPQIGRGGFYYYSAIEERKFTYKGRDYQDMKILVELDQADGELFARKRDAHGGLKGARFEVFRSNKTNSSRRGDDWQLKEKVDPVRHFWYSPAIPRLIEAEQRRGSRAPSHEEAVRAHCEPFDLDKVVGVYDPEEADSFVAYVAGATGKGGPAPASSGGGSSEQQGYGSYGSTPPPPSGASPDYGAQYSGQQPASVPAGQVPQTPPPPPAQGQTQAQPQAAPATPPPPPAQYGQQTQATPATPPPPAQTQAAPRPMPSVPDQAPVPQGYAAPPPPWDTGAGQAQGQPAQQAPQQGSVPPPPPATTPQPTAAAAPPPAPTGDAYDFETGFSANEPF